MQHQLLKLEQKVKKYLSSEAISRLGNLKTAHPELALKTIMVLANAIDAGQLTEQIDDNGLKSLLIQLRQK